MMKGQGRWKDRMRWCTVVALSLFGFGAVTEAFAERKYSEWAEAVHLGCVDIHPGGINSPVADRAGALSKDGLSLYLGSNRAGGQGSEDLYVAQRRSRDEPWSRPENLDARRLEKNLPAVVNTPGNDNVPSLSRDGHWLFFISNRPGGFGDLDIWASFREHVHDDFAWETPFNLGKDKPGEKGVNSAGFDAGPGYFENQDGDSPRLYFNRAPSFAQAGLSDIYESELQSDGTFGPGRLVMELNSPKADQRPSIRFDGLEIFFFSNRDGSTAGSQDIWAATRNSVNVPWDPPANLGDKVNTASDELTPHISEDGLTLLFASSRPGGCGGLDLYMSTRTKH